MFDARPHIHWLLPLALAVAAIAIPAAQADTKADARAAATRALHWQHENALYATQDETPQARRRELIALHFKHEDEVHLARERASGRGTASAVVEAAGDGFQWRFVFGAAGTAVALIIIGATVLIGTRRRERPVLEP